MQKIRKATHYLRALYHTRMRARRFLRTLTIRHLTTPDELDAAFRLRYEIFCKERNLLPVDRFPDGREQDAHDQYSEQFLALAGTEPIGTIRLIKHSPLGFPMVALHPLPRDVVPDRFVEVSRVAVVKSARSVHGIVLLGLCRAISEWSATHGMTDWGARLDERILKRLQFLGIPFSAVYGPFDVPGDPEPLYCAFSDVARTQRVLTSRTIKALLGPVRIQT